MTAGTVKVSVRLTLEVDANGWTQDYGVSGSAAIRKDVQEYVRSVLNSSSENFNVVEGS